MGYFNVRNKGRTLTFMQRNSVHACFYHTDFLESCYVYNIVCRGLHIKKSLYIKILSTGSIESWKNISRKSELELLNKLIKENGYTFFKQCLEFNFKFDEFESHSSEIAILEWFSKLLSALEKFELNTKRHKLRKLKKIIHSRFIGSVWKSERQLDNQYKQGNHDCS